MTTAAGQSSIHDALEVLHQSGVKTRYDNYIGGNFVPPTTGRYFVSTSPINQEPICEFARSGAADQGPMGSHLPSRALRRSPQDRERARGES